MSEEIAKMRIAEELEKTYNDGFARGAEMTLVALEKMLDECTFTQVQAVVRLLVKGVTGK